MDGRRGRLPTSEWEALIRKAKALIPSVEKILDEALNALSLGEEFVRYKFGEALRQVDERATKFYLGYERQALEFVAREWLEQQREQLQAEWRRLWTLLQKHGWEAFKQEVVPMFVDFAQLVQRLEKDLGNMRKARGGLTFERAVEELLLTLGIPCEQPKVRWLKS